jgi:hypothetical protein
MFMAEKKRGGISGTRIMGCLNQLMAEGKVKTAEKCVQWGRCFYDPPKISREWEVVFALGFLSKFFEGFIQAFTTKTWVPVGHINQISPRNSDMLKAWG